MAATASMNPSQQSLSVASPVVGNDVASHASPRTSAAQLSSIPPFNRTASATSLVSVGEHAAPQFTSSLPYTQVRDFAYPSIHPLHYGPQPKDPNEVAASQRESQFYEFSGGSGGAWAQNFGRRSSDPAHSSSFASGTEWDSFWERDTANLSGKVYPPPLRFEDGPPWSEDEDLHSPVVRPSRHKSREGGLAVYSGHSRGPSGSSIMNGEANINSGRAQSQLLGAPADAYYQTAKHAEQDYPDDSDLEDPSVQQEWYEEDYTGDQSRLSQEFWISIGSPEEEMHGKAVALFDFVRENDNELGLVEGQVIWISYRHGMGWLVAQDPKTGDTGLVPEEYVRLLRDIQQHELDQSVEESQSPTTTSPDSSTAATDNTQATSPLTKNTPIISSFSTSSQDIYPYPLPFHQPGDHPPPEQVRSSSGTPTVTSQEERVRQIQRERERALIEEEAETPRFGGRKGSVFSTGYREDDDDVTPVQGNVMVEIKGDKEDKVSAEEASSAEVDVLKRASKETEAPTLTINTQVKDETNPVEEVTPAKSTETQTEVAEPVKQQPTIQKAAAPGDSQAKAQPDSTEATVKNPVTVEASKVDTTVTETSMSTTDSSVPPEDKPNKTR